MRSSTLNPKSWLDIVNSMKMQQEKNARLHLPNIQDKKIHKLENAYKLRLPTSY